MPGACDVPIPATWLLFEQNLDARPQFDWIAIVSARSGYPICVCLLGEVYHADVPDAATDWSAFRLDEQGGAIGNLLVVHGHATGVAYCQKSVRNGTTYRTSRYCTFNAESQTPTARALARAMTRSSGRARMRGVRGTL